MRNPNQQQRKKQTEFTSLRLTRGAASLCRSSHLELQVHQTITGPALQPVGTVDNKPFYSDCSKSTSSI